MRLFFPNTLGVSLWLLFVFHPCIIFGQIGPPTENLVGIYFDEGYSLPCINADYGSEITGYLCLVNCTQSGGVGGWELRVDTNLDLLGVTWVFPDGAISIYEPPNFLVGLPEPLPWQPSIVLMEFSFLLLQTETIEFSLLPTVPSSIPDEMVFSDGIDPGLIIAMYPICAESIYGPPDTCTVAKINDCFPICSLEPDPWDFGEVPVGSYYDKVLTIENTGFGTLSGTITDPENTFTILEGGGDFFLGFGETHSFSVRCAPESFGILDEYVQVDSTFCGEIPLLCTGSHPWNTNGDPICTSFDDQFRPKVVSTTDEGVVVAWDDGFDNIYLQKRDSSGINQWSLPDVSVLDSSSFSRVKLHQLSADNFGGVYILFSLLETSVWKHYVQHVDSAGSVNWLDRGLELGEGDEILESRICSDKNGNAIVTWLDSQYGLYATKIGSGGSSEWGDQGLLVCSVAANKGYFCTIISPSNSVLVSWLDYRSDPGASDIFAQRISGDGTILWNGSGVAVCTEASDQITLQMVSDGTEGAILKWADSRSGSHLIYAQRINENGGLLWSEGGNFVPTGGGRLIGDGLGGAITVGAGAHEVRAQRINPDGQSLWLPDGIFVANIEFGEGNLYASSIGSGKFIAVWSDGYWMGDSNIFAQQFDMSGEIIWDSPEEVCVAPCFQGSPNIDSDGSGNVFVCWRDYRNDPLCGPMYGENADIYAAKLTVTCSVNPTNLDFGVVAVGDFSEQSFSVTNTGHDLLSGYVSESNPNFVITEGSGNFELAYSETLQVVVRYAPLSGGEHSTVVDLGTLNCSSVNCTGQALSPYHIGSTYFDGNHDYIIVPNSDTIDEATDFTIEAWVWPQLDPGKNEFNNPSGAVLSRGDTETGWPDEAAWRIDVESTGHLKFTLFGTLADLTYLSDIPLPGDRYSHIAITVDEIFVVGVRLDIFIDGQPHGSHTFAAGALLNTLSPLWIGGHALLEDDVPVNRYFHGLVDEVRYWSKVRTQAEIQSTMHGPLDPAIYNDPGSDLIGYWDLNAVFDLGVGGDGMDDAMDLSPNNNHGDYENGATLIVSPTPVYEVDPTFMDFGWVSIGDDLTLDFVVRNLGEGALLGAISEQVECQDWLIASNEGEYCLAPQESLVVDIRFQPTVEGQSDCQIATGWGVVDCTGIGTAVSSLPDFDHVFAFHPNVPNPFNPSTRLLFKLDAAGMAKLKIYDISGRLIRTLVHETLAAGRHEVVWDSRDNLGNQVSSGVYFACLQSQAGQITRKITLVK